MARTVLIVDDHAGFRAAARALLEASGFEVVAEAADGAGALAESERTRPDIVLLDVQLPDIDGFEVAERLGGEPPAVVLVSSRDAGSYRRKLGRTRVRGFLSKGDLTGQAVSDLVG